MTKTAPRTARRIVLAHPPAYLSEVPDSALSRHSSNAPTRGADAILDALRGRGIYARPTLAEVEAERARRGRARYALVGAPAREVLA